MRLAIIGTGNIVGEALYAMEPLTEIEKNAIYARPKSVGKGQELAKKYGIKEVYTDYQELLEHADIDTVYIGLINSVHYEYAKQALMAEKNVIVEKPFSGTYEEASELARIAREKRLFLFEAITILHNDLLIEMKKSLPKLGQIRMMLANYSQYSRRYDGYLKGDIHPSFTPVAFGGALFDINVYNIHYAVALFGAPKTTAYYPNLGFNGIDTSGTLIMNYDGFSVVCTGAKDSDSACFLSVQGEKGSMKFDGKPNSASSFQMTSVNEADTSLVRDASGAMVRSMITSEYQSPKKHHRMTQEFQDFARMIDQGDIEKANRYLEESLTVMKILDDNAVWNR